MAIEFTSNCYGMQYLEDICKELIKQGMGKKLKDTRATEFEPERYGADPNRKEELQNKGFDVIVYKQYLLHVKTGPVYLPWDANIRFWYDKRVDRAGVKISAEALLAIVESVTVANVLKKLDIQLGGDKGDGLVTLEKLATALTQAVSRASKRAEVSFKAERSKR